MGVSQVYSDASVFFHSLGHRTCPASPSLLSRGKGRSTSGGIVLSPPKEGSGQEDTGDPDLLEVNSLVSFPDPFDLSLIYTPSHFDPGVRKH